MGRPRGWDEAAMAAAVELAAGGLTYPEAAARTGVPPNAISARLRAAGVVRAPVRAKVGPPRIPVEVVRPALVAVARGVRVEDAAADAGVGVSTLRRRIREHGVVVLRERTPRKDALTLAERGRSAPGSSLARTTPTSRLGWAATAGASAERSPPTAAGSTTGRTSPNNAPMSSLAGRSQRGPRPAPPCGKRCSG